MAKPKSDMATLVAVAQLLAVVAIVAALFFAKDVLIPLALGLLLSFLLSPIVDRLQRSGVSNVLAVVTTALIAFLMLGAVFTLLGRELSTLVSELPSYKSELVEKARGVAGATGDVSGSLDELAEEVTGAIEEGADPDSAPDAEDRSAFRHWTDRLLPADLAVQERPHDGATAKTPIFVRQVQAKSPLATWATTAGTVLGPLTTAGLVTVFALFMLIHREDLRDRLIAVVSHGDYVTTTEAMDEAARRISRYLIAQTLVNTGYGLTLAIGLSAIGAVMTEAGFPNAIMWGVLGTCLRFAPYIGPTAAAVFPSAIALAVFPGYSVFLAVVALIGTMELICNNVIEPWIYGGSTGLSAVAVIFAAVFWGWLWGPVGLLLSTPLTVCLVVLGQYVPRFQILSTLFAEDVVIEPSLRFYQRLLAADEHRAREILKERVEEDDVITTIDRVIVPALKQIRTDQDSGQLAESDANRLFALMGGLIADLKAQAPSSESAENEPTIETQCKDVYADKSTVIGCTSHHFSEAFVLNLLRTTAQDQFELQSIDDDSLPLQVGEEVARRQPQLVVIVVLPPGGFAQARYHCQSIRRAGFDGPIVVAALGKFRNYDKLFVKLRKAGATNMTTSFSQTQSKIGSILKLRDPVSVTQDRQSIAEQSPPLSAKMS